MDDNKKIDFNITKIIYLDINDKPTFEKPLNFEHWVRKEEAGMSQILLIHAQTYYKGYRDYLKGFKNVPNDKPIEFVYILDRIAGDEVKPVDYYDEIIVLGKYQRGETCMFAGKKNGEIDQIYVGLLNNGEVR